MVTIGIVDWTAAASLLAVEAVNVKDMVGSEADRHSSTSKDSKNDDDDKQKCGLYLAVSSTSTAEAPKLGVFAGTYRKHCLFISSRVMLCVMHDD